jgi:hypothetical protein
MRARFIGYAHADVCVYLVYLYMYPSIRFVHTYAHADVCAFFFR